MNPLHIKNALLEQCAQTVDRRFQQIKTTIKGIEESLFEESKSSAGDKHETGRAMLQIERENAGKQLREIEQLQRIIPKINIETTSERAHLGSLVYTEKAIYFLSLSIGDIVIDGTHYLCISAGSPIGKCILGKKKGDLIEFNQTENPIIKIV